MATLDDVQDAIVNTIDAALYPLGDAMPSVLGATITTIAMTAPGTGYTTAKVVISGGNGSGAVAFANIVNGGLLSVSLQDGGAGFTGTPTITITGDGAGATATATIAPMTAYIYAGDPLKQNLDAQLKARNIVNIAVFAMKGMTRDSTRFYPRFADYVIDSATIFTTVSGDTVTLSGTVTAGQAVMVIVKGTGYAYGAVTGDTLNTIATALAALIPGATANNAIITIAGVFDITANVSVAGTARRIVYSQESMFSVDIITPSQSTRKAVSQQLDLLFQTRYLLMPDGLYARIIRNTINEYNKYELALAFERQYIYKVEYHSVDVQQFHTITDPYIIASTDTLPPS